MACIAALAVAPPSAATAARPESIGVLAVAPPPGPTAQVIELTAELRNRIARLAPGTLDARETRARMTGPALAALADLERGAEAARRAYLNREFDRSLGMLRGIASDLERLPDDPAVFELWTKVMTRVARTELDLGHLDEARAAIERVLRAAPDLAVDRSLHPVRFVNEVESARAALKGAPTGTLIVESSSAGARVLVNGRDVGAAPVRLTLPQGRYRISGTKGGARVRSIVADVGKDERAVHLDFAIDEAFRPELGPGLALPADRRPGDIVAIGRNLGLDQVVAVGTVHEGGASYVVAELHVVRGGATERRARVRLANAAFPEGGAAALAELMVTGRVTSPLVEGGVPDEPRGVVPEQARVRLFSDGGVIVPMAPASYVRSWGRGVLVDVGAEYGLGGVVSLWSRVDYAQVPLREQNAKGGFAGTLGDVAGVSGGDLTILGLQAGVRFRRASGRTRPYLEVGAGFERIGTDAIQISYENPSTHEIVGSTTIPNSARNVPALAAGVGLLYALHPSLAVFAGVHVTFLFSASGCYPRDELCFLNGARTSHVPIRIGLRYP